MWQYNNTYPSELYHWGIKGQKWGVRRYRNADGTLTPAGQKRYQKEANKDAKEYARAKMYYGKGAGNRRKLINATVAEKSKDKNYKDAFDKALAIQDMADHANKARSERKRADAKEKAGQAVRGTYHTIVQDGGKVAAWVSLGISVVAGTSLILRETGYDKKIIQKGKNVVSDLINKHGRR